MSNMVFFGHWGITVGLADFANQSVLNKSDEQIDLRVAALLSLLPDLIDKPIGLLWPEFFGNNTRLFAHSLLFSVFIFYIMTRNQFSKARILLWMCFFGHMLLDTIWITNAECFFWPFLGAIPPYKEDFYTRLRSIFLRPKHVLGELIGIFCLSCVFIRHKLWKKQNFMLLMTKGKGRVSIS